MGQVTLYAHAAGDWDVADAWNDAANGSGTHYTNPQNGTPANTTYICVLNSLAMHANVDITVDAIQAPASDIGTLTIEGTRVINVGSSNGIVYGHTLTTGMIVVPTGTNLTINGQVVNSAAGYAVVTAGTAVLAVSNVGGTAVACTAGAGRTIYHAATGSLTITGIVDSSTTASGYAIYCDSAAVISITGNVTHSDATTTHYGIYTVTGNNTLTIDGTVVSSGGGFALYLRSGTATINHDISSSHTGVALAGALYVNGATVTLLGDIVDSASWATVYIASGTLNWYGAHTVAASKNACIWLRGGILNFVLQGNPFTPLVLTNNGSFVLIKTGGTLNTADAGAGAAQINNQTAPSPTAGAYAAMIGCTDAQKAIITGPTLPAENVVKDGESFGYPGDPQEGTYDQYPNIIWPSESNVTTDEPNYGPTGVDYHGEIDMSTYTLIAGVVDAEFVIVGHDNYTDGDAGEYPTTATSQAAQLATDQGVVLAAAASIKDDVSILDQAGTYDFTAAIAAGFTAGQADQYATDQAEVTAKADHLSDTETICAIAGTLDLDLYTLIATVLSPDDALLGVDRYDSDPTPGTCRLPVQAKVEDEYAYGPSDTMTGELVGGGSVIVIDD